MRRKPANFGDYVVVDSMLRVVAHESARNVQFPSPGAEVPKSPDPNADLVVIRGANYLRDNLDLTGLGELIRKLGLPCVVMGIGAQLPRYGRMNLSQGTIDAMRILSDHCEVVGTRGDFTAQVLQDIGISNAEPVGCPSLFRQLRPDVAIAAPVVSDIKNIAFTMNRNMTGMYGNDRTQINRFQRKLFMDMLQRGGRVGVFCQGEPAEFIAAHKLKREYDRARRDLASSGFLDDPKDALFDQFIESAVSPSSIQSWENLVLDYDFVVGMRFHGNTVALANGLPSVYLVNDTRVHELAEHFSIPYVDLRTANSPPDIEELIKSADFSAFNARYPAQYARFVDYLDSNRVFHRLGSGPASSSVDGSIQPEPLSCELTGEKLHAWLQGESRWGSARVEQLERKVKSLTGQVESLKSERDVLREKIGG